MAFTLENACNELRPASLPMDGRLFSFQWITTGRLEKVLTMEHIDAIVLDMLLYGFHPN